MNYNLFVGWPIGSKEWYLNDEQLSEEEFNRRMKSCDGEIVEVDGKKYQLKAVCQV